MSYINTKSLEGSRGRLTIVPARFQEWKTLMNIKPIHDFTDDVNHGNWRLFIVFFIFPPGIWNQCVIYLEGSYSCRLFPINNRTELRQQGYCGLQIFWINFINYLVFSNVVVFLDYMKYKILFFFEVNSDHQQTIEGGKY